MSLDNILLIPGLGGGSSLLSGTLAPGQDSLDFGYSAGSFGVLTGAPSISSVIANSTDMRITMVGGGKIKDNDSIWFIWDNNEIVLSWNASGYYICTIDSAVEYLVFRDHFERQLGIAKPFDIKIVPALENQIEYWESSCPGSIQGASIRTVQDLFPSNDATWLSESEYADAFGTSWAWGQPDESGNVFQAINDAIPLNNGGTIAMVGEKFTGDTIAPQNDTTTGCRFSFTDTTATLVLLDPTEIFTESFSLSAGQHAFVLTIEPDGLGDATYTVYVDGSQVLQATAALRPVVAQRILIADSCRVSQLIRDQNVWTSAQITAHYNSGSFARVNYGPRLVGVVHGDSLTYTPNRNTWYDTISARRYKFPSWKDYLREKHGKLMLGNGFESRELFSADTSLKTIQRFAHLPAGTRHFLYLGINNLAIDPTPTLGEMQSQLNSCISTIEGQGHEAVLFKLPPVEVALSVWVATETLYSDYDAWLDSDKSAYKIIDPKVVLADPGTRDLKAIYNTTKAGAVRPGTDILHYNNYGHRDLAAYISQLIDSWGG